MRSLDFAQKTGKISRSNVNLARKRFLKGEAKEREEFFKKNNLKMIAFEPKGEFLDYNFIYPAKQEHVE